MKSAEVKCAHCGRSVEICYLCEEPECRHVICRECLEVDLGQTKAVTYTAAESP